MMNAVEQVLSTALALTPEERAEVAERLLASLESSLAEIDPLWRTEIFARIAEIDSGAVKPIDHSQVMSRAREALARRRA